MTKKLHLSESELVVMRIVWTLQEVTSEQIRSALDAKFHWSASTIKTFLRRLLQKEMVKAVREGHNFVYSSKRSEEEAVKLLTAEFMRKICACKHPEAIQQMIEGSDLTEKDQKNLESVLMNKRLVNEIRCDCLNKM
jgi:CopY/TcrY family copper transport repressor